MTTPTSVVDRRALTTAVFTRLRGVSNQTAYKGEAISVPAVNGYVSPYTVLFPGSGVESGEQDLAETAVDLDWLIQITCAAGYVDDLMALVTRVDAAFYRWQPVIPGYSCGLLKPPPGFQTVQLLDRDVTPHRPFLPLQYRCTVTAT